MKSFLEDTSNPRTNIHHISQCFPFEIDKSHHCYFLIAVSLVGRLNSPNAILSSHPKIWREGSMTNVYESECPQSPDSRMNTL